MSARLGRLVPAGILGCLTFVLIGWSGLLMPSLIRSVKEAFDQTDAGIGLFYFLFAASYATGSLGGGLVTERLGRRTVLSLAAALHGVALVTLGLAPSWAVFLVAAVPAGLGAGGLDGGGNGLFLDLFRTGRGRALNLLHLFFSLGALGAPLAVGRLVDLGVGWQLILLGTGLAAMPVAALYAVVAMPGGRRARSGVPSGETEALGRLDRMRGRLAAPLLLLGLAIACYVASEIGVSNWLVRFLEPVPLSEATTALSLFWAGLTLGRLVSARLSDRFDHLRFVTVSVAAMSLALLGAILVPSVPVSIALFALTGFASGPVFPMIIALGGERYPDRSAAVGGFLSGVAVAGSVIYPPVMGFLSVTVGLTVAMLGNVVLGVACMVALVLVGRVRVNPA
jgi:FHS family glucose/mannose:H+ symporter-like MFS transporter